MRHSQRLIQPEAISKYHKIHGNRYDTSQAVYVNSKTKWKIICPIHGEFWQRPNASFSGQGCKQCHSDDVKITQSQAIQRYENVHTDRYDTTEAIYVDIRTEWKLICPIHGEFWQQPRSGFDGRGCPKCNKSTGELSVGRYLKDRNITNIPQKTFSGLTGLGDGRLSYDFYLPERNTCIEYDGKQHFEPIDYWGGKKYYTIVKEHDKRKTHYCKEYNIKLIRIPYWNIDNIENILSNTLTEIITV